MKWKTGFPEKSGKVLGVSGHGGMYLLNYSSKHKLFNAYDSDELDTAIDDSIKIVKWIPVEDLLNLEVE